MIPARTIHPSVRRLAIAGALALVAVLPSLAAANDDAPDNGWTAERRKDDARLQLSVRRTAPGMRWTSSFPIERSELFGLGENDVRASRADVAFELRREAGVFRFEGKFESGHGHGRFRFVPNPAFVEGLERAHLKGADENAIYACALNGVTLEFVRGLQSLGYGSITLDDATRLAIHDMTLEDLRAYRAAGLERPTIDELARLAVHHVTPQRVRDLGALGYAHLGVDELVRMSIHGADPDYVRALRRLDYREIPVESLIRMRIHGVTPEYVQELRGLGYPRVDDETLIRMRIHGVTPAFIRRVAARRADKPSAEELIQLRLQNKS